MLKFQVDSLDGLEDPVKALYQEKDGKFTLKVDGGPTVDTSKMEEELELFRTKHAEAEKHRKEQEKIARAAAIEAAQKSGDLESLRKSLEEEKKAVRDEYEPRLKAYENTITRLTVGAAASQIAAEVFGEHAELMIHHVKGRLTNSLDGDKTVVKVIDSDGNPSAKSIDDLKTEFRTNTKYAPFVVGSKASGGGGPRVGGTPDVKVRSLSAQEKNDFIIAHGQKKYLELSAKERKKTNV